MRIFPIPAGAEQRVKLTYYQELDADHDWATYVYPLATVSRSGIDQQDTGPLRCHDRREKRSADRRRWRARRTETKSAIAKHGENYWRASMEIPAGMLDRDVVLAFRSRAAKTGFDVITSKTSGEAGFFQLSLTAGKELEELGQGMDYVFVLDVSGSMANDGKLPLSRQSLGQFHRSRSRPRIGLK